MGHVVVYGDFESPLSRVASERVDALAQRGVAIEWRAVQVRKSEPRHSRVVGVAAVRPGISCARLEASTACRRVTAEWSPHVDMSVAVAALAAVDGEDAHTLRAALFRAHWVEHRDLSDPRVIAEIAGGPVCRWSARASSWQRAWEGFADPAVPLVQLVTGYVFRDTDAISALDHLLELSPTPPRASRSSTLRMFAVLPSREP
jgi:hypothetical protein